MSANRTTEAVSFGHYARLLRRRWPSLVAGVAIGLVLAALWFQATPRSYTAEATVSVTPITTELFSGSPINQLVNTATEAEIMASTEVARRAAVISGIDADPRDILNSLSVRVPTGSTALVVSYRGASPTRAADGANAFATAYLDFRFATAEARRSAYTDRLSDQLTSLTDSFAALDEGDGERASIAEEIGALRQQIGDAALLTLTPGELVSQALPPRTPSSPRLLIALPAGLVLGAALGVVIAAVRHRTDDRVLRISEIEQDLGRGVLGVLPPVDADAPVDGRVEDEVALAAERLRSAVPADDLRPVLVVRADVGGRTQAALLDAALARRAASQGVHVDVHRPAPVRRELVDGEGIVLLADVIAASHDVAAIVVVVELGRTRAADVERALTELERSSKAPVVPELLVVERAWSSDATARLGRRRRDDVAPDRATPDPRAFGGGPVPAPERATREPALPTFPPPTPPGDHVADAVDLPRHAVADEPVAAPHAEDVAPHVAADPELAPHAEDAVSAWATAAEARPPEHDRRNGRVHEMTLVRGVDGFSQPGPDATAREPVDEPTAPQPAEDRPADIEPADIEPAETEPDPWEQARRRLLASVPAHDVHGERDA